MSDLGFIGLGTMGSAMASHLISAGHDLTVYDLDEEAVDAVVTEGGIGAQDPKMVAEASDVVFFSLPNPDVVEAVVDEIEDSFRTDATLIDLTTSTPNTTMQIADRLTERDVTVLGAPVSGGRSGAKSGTLSVMVGGDVDVYEEHTHLFEHFASDVFHIGDNPGHGHAIKLLNNYLSFAGLIAASEAVVLGEQVGLDLELMLEVFSNSTGRNSATDEKLHHVVDGGFDYGFDLGLMEKDMRLLSRFSEENQSPMLLANVIRSLVGYTRADYGGNADMTYFYKFCKRTMGDSEASFPAE